MDRLFISHTTEAGGICFRYSVLLYSAAQIHKWTTADNPHIITVRCCLIAQKSGWSFSYLVNATANHTQPSVGIGTVQLQFPIVGLIAHTQRACDLAGRACQKSHYVCLSCWAVQLIALFYLWRVLSTGTMFHRKQHHWAFPWGS